MLDIKNNFRGKYRDMKCRGCKGAEETQNHVLQECESIHNDETTKVRESEYFSDDIEILKVAASNIRLIQERIGQSDVPSVDQRVRPGTRVHTRITN